MKLLRATAELDLIMYVMKKGRVTTADTTCYDLLVKKIGYGLESTSRDKGRTPTSRKLVYLVARASYREPGTPYRLVDARFYLEYCTP